MRKLMNRKGQGTTEYIVILGFIVAIAVALIWGNMQGGLNHKMTNVTSILNT